MIFQSLVLAVAVPHGPRVQVQPQAADDPVIPSYDRVIDLPATQFVERVFEKGGDVYAEITGPGAVSPAKLDSGAFLTIEAGAPIDQAGLATTLPPDGAADGSSTAGDSSACGLDWMGLVDDPASGRMHISSSLDGCTVLLLSRDDDLSPDGNVFVFQKGGESKLRPFQGLIQASLSPGGEVVLVQTVAGLHFFWVQDFLGSGKSQLMQVTGEEQWKIAHVRDGDSSSPGLFLLKKKLSVELYSTRASGTAPEHPTSLALFFVETSNYAIQAEYCPTSRIMMVAERKRVRVARLDEDYNATFLIDYKLDPHSEEEIRSAQLDLASAKREVDPQVRVAVGLRRKVVVPTRAAGGSCDVQFRVLLAKEEGWSTTSQAWPVEAQAHGFAPEGHVLFESEWDEAARFNADSPRVQFAREGTKLFSATRDQVWRFEVTQ